MDSISALDPLIQYGIMTGILFAAIGILMELMKASYHWSFVAKYRVRQELPRKVDNKEHARATRLNTLISTSMFLFTTIVFFDALLYVGEASYGRMGFEILAMLLIYDFLYYLLHRYIYHQWEVGRKWHSIHHRIRTPKTKDSLYIHPMETILGVSAMLLSIWWTGLLSGALFGASFGMHIVAYGIGFFIYSILNLYIHSAIQFPMFPLTILSALNRNHDMHHTSMRGGYYASITPLWDILLKTNVEIVKTAGKSKGAL